MRANPQQVGYIILGLVFGYVIAGEKGAFIGALIGFFLSYGRRFF